MLNEFDHFLALDNRGVKTYENGAAMNNRIAEWLATPMYTVADDPVWGNNLASFQHDPESPTLALEMEMSITRKLPQDVKGITIRNINVTFTDIDRCIVTIGHNLGQYQREINLSGEIVTSGIL